MADGDNIIVQTGGSEPLPSPEYDLGNIVKLKKPYDDRYQYGIIVQHVGRNFVGVPKVALLLYDAGGVLEMDAPPIPTYCDTVACDFVILTISSWIGTKVFGRAEYLMLNDGEGYDPYPKCPGCGDEDQHPFQEDEENKCPQCGGWGFIKNPKAFDGGN